MRLKVNGEERSTDRETIAELLRELDIASERVAVEVNLRVLKKAEYENFRLQDNDIVEIVYFVGGGLC